MHLMPVHTFDFSMQCIREFCKGSHAPPKEQRAGCILQRGNQIICLRNLKVPLNIDASGHRGPNNKLATAYKVGRRQSCKLEVLLAFRAVKSSLTHLSAGLNFRQAVQDLFLRAISHHCDRSSDGCIRACRMPRRSINSPSSGLSTLKSSGSPPCQPDLCSTCSQKLFHCSC